MSLNGNLESFPLPEVLRLLARAGKSGCLRVDAQGVLGKLYLEEGALVFGTATNDEDFRTDLMAAGMVDDQAWQMVERRERSVPSALAEGVSPGDLTRFVTKRITDLLFQLQRPGGGTFDFDDNVMPRYPTEQRIDPELSIGDAQAQLDEWHEIEEVIPGMNFRLKMVDRLEAERDMTVTPDIWHLLAALRGESTVTEVAQRVGSTDFQVAKAMATLVRAGLLTVVDSVAKGSRYGYGEELAPGGFELGADLVNPEYMPAAKAASKEVETEDLLQDVLAGIVGEEGGAEPGDTPSLPRRRGLGSLAKELGELNELNDLTDASELDD